MGELTTIEQVNQLDVFNNAQLLKNVDFKLKEVATVCANASRLADNHNRTASQYTWKQFNVSDYGLCRNMSKALANLISRKDALMSAQFKLAEQQAVLDEFIEAHETMTPRQLIKRAKKEYEINNSMGYVKGAMKDIMALGKCVTDLEAKIQEKYGKPYSEELFEEEEKEYWVKNLFSQALHDLRESGRIGKGVQQNLERMNLNITAVSNICKNYLEEEARAAQIASTNDECMSGTLLRSFLDNAAKKCANHAITYNIEKGLTESDVTFMSQLPE